MKKLIFVFAFIFAAAISAMAQDWSEYSRGSDSWHRLNRNAMTRPWKYDRGGRLKKGSPYGHSVASHRRRRRHR